MWRAAWLRFDAWILAAIVLFASGCTSPREYIRNGFKVGPSCGVPQGSTAPQWIDEADVRVQEDYGDPGAWWTVFQDQRLTG